MIFGHFARLPSNGVPYVPFVLCGLVPWQFFSQVLGESTQSVVANQVLIRKVYFPRLYLPLTPLVAALVDLGIASIVLVVALGFYRIAPSHATLALPLFALLAVLAAFGASVWLSALNVRFRDVRYTVPFLIQIWFFATPVVYPSSLLPERLRPLLGLNPMSTVADGFRWALVGAPLPSGHSLLASCTAVVVLVGSGLLYFRHVDATLADTV